MKPGRISLYVALVLAVLAALLALLVQPEANAPPDFVRFIGRFHTLVVHLPIGILTLIAVAELASLSSRVKPRVDPAIGLALPVVAATSVVAFILGLLLARGSGYPSDLIALHRGLTLGAIALLPVCAALWAGPVQNSGARGRWFYRAALGLAVTLMSVGAHFGGSMTKGENYLVQYAPKFVRGMLGVKEAEPLVPDATPVADPLVWEHSVLPILHKHCVECHGEKETKGGLRLDSLAALMKGGDEGVSVVPGHAVKSSLVGRMKLPLGNDERMPPDDKPGPSEAEIALIGWWVDRGASDALKVREGVVPAPVSELLSKALSQAAPSAAGSGGTATADAPAADAGAATASGSEDEDEDDDEGDEDDEGDDEFGPTPSYSSGSDDDDDSDDDDSDDSEGGTVPVSGPVAKKPGPVWSQLVAPLLDQRCGKCHGEKRQKGKFRVDSLAALIKGGKEGPGVVPGNSSAGTLLGRIRSKDKKLHMPPYKEPQVTSAELELLAWWVKQGASDKISTSALSAPLAAKWAPVSDKPGPGPAAPAGPAPGAATDAGAPESTSDAGDAGAPTASLDAGTASAGVSDPAEPSIALYTDLVKPLLAKRCGACHSGAGAMGVNIDDLPGMLEGGDIVPGDPDSSPLLTRQLVPLEDLSHMPPKSEPQPAAWELEVIRLWIKDGAKADARVAIADLPPEAVPQGKGAQEPDAGPGTAPGVKAPATAGGCAACAVGSSQAGGAPYAPLGFGAGFVAAAVALLRRRARRSRRG